MPGVPDVTSRINNLFMAALLWASRSDCDCKACQRLKRLAELMEESMEAEV
mgnify:CR=1 FL=1